MRIKIHLSTLLPCCFFLHFSLCLLAQERLSSDDLFQMARKEAFDHKNYPQAIAICRQALVQSPDYKDIRVFLGRIYTWSGKTDSARAEFLHVLRLQPDNADALSAFTDLEYWNDQFENALHYCNTALQYHPGSKEFLLKKARILAAMQQYEQAAAVTDSLLRIDPENSLARALVSTIRDRSIKNRIGATYDLLYFDKNYPDFKHKDPWQLASISYGRSTKIGTIIGRLNYAHRFGNEGTQLELESYPSLGRIFYAYVGGAYSNSSSVFPDYRAGFSLYASLPSAFEGELGFRYLYFGSNTWVYTASAGKYYKNFWFNFRTYLTPGNEGLSQSYTFTTRWYRGGTDDYWTFAVGTGISPDDRSRTIDFKSSTRFIAKRLIIGYQHTVWRRNIMGISGTFLNETFPLGTATLNGNQFNLSLLYQRRF